VVLVPAGDTRVISLDGYVIRGVDGAGLSIQMAAALTGTVNATLTWFER